MPAALVLASLRRPLRFGLAVGCLILGVTIYDRKQEDRIYEGRGFFGFVKVKRVMDTYDEGLTWHTYHVLVHGGIDHGRQNLDPDLRRLMTSAVLAFAAVAMRARRTVRARRRRTEADIIEARHLGGHHWVAYGWNERS